MKKTNRTWKGIPNGGGKARQKRWRKTITAWGMSFVLCCGMLSGCGQSKKQLPEVSLSVWSAKEDEEFLHKAIDSFQQEYAGKADFHINVSEENETTCRDTVLADPKAAADLFSFAGDQFYSLQQAGALLEVTEEPEDIILECGGDQSDAARSAMADGKLYAYPATASNGYFLYYNRSYFTEEDVQSFDRILQIAAEQKKKVSMDFSSGWYLYSFFKGAGLSVDWNKEKNTNDCNWNAQDTKYTGKQVAQALLDIASQEGFQSATTEEFKQNVIEKGDMIAGISGVWDAKDLETAWGENYAAVKLPTYTLAGEQVQMHSFTGFKLLGVNAHVKKQEWAMRLARWITNEKNQELRFDMRGERPANAKAASSAKVESDPVMAALNAQSEFGHLQNVADTFWTPTHLFGTEIAAKNPDGTDLQILLDQMVKKITAVPEHSKEDGETSEEVES